MFIEELKKYLNSRIYVETNGGKFVFGDLISIENSCIKVQFIDKTRVLTIPLHAIVSVRKFDDLKGGSYGK